MKLIPALQCWLYYNAGYDAGDVAGYDGYLDIHLEILPSQDNSEWFSSLCHNLFGYSHWGRLNESGHS